MIVLIEEAGARIIKCSGPVIRVQHPQEGSMFPNRNIPLMVLVSLHYIIPAALIIWLWAGENRSKFRWSVKTLFVALYLVLIYFIGFWGFVSFYWRYLWFVLFALATIFSYSKARRVPFHTKLGAANWILIGLESALAILFLYFIAGAVGANFLKPSPCNCRSPSRAACIHPAGAEMEERVPS